MTPLEAVRAELGEIPTRDDAETRAVYGHDESDTADFPPDLVVFARSRAEVQQVLRACMKHRVPVTPVAARSGKSGGSLPLSGGVSLSLERMNRIVEINPEDCPDCCRANVISVEFTEDGEARVWSRRE